MAKRDKLLQKILDGKRISYVDAEKILISLGYLPKMPSGGSSHVTFRKNNCEQITLVKTQNPLKDYLMKQIREVLE
ncbi:MAG: toxin HicA [bacterium]